MGIYQKWLSRQARERKGKIKVNFIQISRSTISVSAETLLVDLYILYTDEHGGRVLYISTDYVFDGTKPPYKADDEPGPVNLYGQLKLEGEQAVLKVMTLGRRYHPCKNKNWDECFGMLLKP